MLTVEQPIENSTKQYIHSEPELLIACARIDICSERAALIRRLAGGRGVDWNVLFALSEQHCVAPLLYHALNSCAADLVPADQLQKLRLNYKSGTRHNMVLTAEMLRIVERMDNADIQSVPFKGPVLAQCVYQDISLRSFADLDILVRDKDLKAASAVLGAMGYIREHNLTPEQEAAYIKHEHAFQFEHQVTGTVVELHWRLGPKNLSFAIDGPCLWARLQTIPLFGSRILSLAPEDLFVYLSMHGAKHYWERLEWICSISQLINQRQNIKWELVMSRASQLGAGRIVRLSLVLASTILNNEHARELLASYPADPVATMLASKVREHLFGSEMTHQVRQAYRHTFYLQTRERFADRLRGLIFAGIRAPHPLSKDLVQYQVPKSLSFLYYLLRPVRLTQDHGLTGLLSVLRPGKK